MNRVSVVIPNYNRSGLVNATVRNVLAQTLAPFEVIVVDDGSTDDSSESLRREFGDRIQLIEQLNQGPGAARNAGLKIASGDYLWLMDSDDLASLNKLETQVDALQRYHAEFVYSPWARAWIDGRAVRIQDSVLQQRPLPSSRDCLTWFSNSWSLVFQHCLFRRSLIERTGLYRTDMWTCDDSEYFYRVLLQEPKIVFDDRSITLYRLDDHGKVTGSGFASSRRITDWARCLLAVHPLLEHHNPEIVRQSDYRFRLFSALESLHKNCPSETDLIEQLNDLLDSRPKWRWELEAFGRRLRTGIRRRINGHSWSRGYQPGPLTSQQRTLIGELGYCL